ncbi:MAG: DUF1800 domain-containing protein [Sulfitobacter sp.]
MSFDAHIAARRFGYGLSPVGAAPGDVAQMLSGITDPDQSVAAHPIPEFRHLQDALVLRRRFASFAREKGDTAEGKEAQQKNREIQRRIRNEHDQWFLSILMRQISSPHGFRERLVAFWADHFTAAGKADLLRFAGPIYVDEAVRPHIGGNFADLLTSCITHPLMLHYLDQNTSAGPNSWLVRRRNPQRGLNENLAREALELHTLGVGGPYAQADVHALAKLFTGMSTTRNYSFKFRSRMSEPGPKDILGQRYGPKPGMKSIRQALQNLATHPSTARHLARKLAVHFVSDDPPDDLIAAIETAYLRSGGALMDCYAALLEHPAAWTKPAHNIRPPAEFIATALRALAPSPTSLRALDREAVQRAFFKPLELMGHSWGRPAGPDGLPEDDNAWITPQGVSARLEWAVTVPATLMTDLPDPRDFVRTALGDDIPKAVAVAASAAESKQVAIGLVLSSPAFQRR